MYQTFNFCFLLNIGHSGQELRSSDEIFVAITVFLSRIHIYERKLINTQGFSNHQYLTTCKRMCLLVKTKYKPRYATLHYMGQHLNQSATVWLWIFGITFVRIRQFAKAFSLHVLERKKVTYQQLQ